MPVEEPPIDEQSPDEDDRRAQEFLKISGDDHRGAVLFYFIFFLLI